MRALLLLILVAGVLAGCVDGEPLPQPDGPLFALNPGLWQPSPAELQDVPKAGPQ